MLPETTIFFAKSDVSSGFSLEPIVGLHCAPAVPLLCNTVPMGPKIRPSTITYNADLGSFGMVPTKPWGKQTYITGHRRICKSFNLLSFTICVHHAAKPHHQVPSHVFDLGAAASLQRDMLRLCWFKTGILIITSIIMITFHNIINNNTNK